MKKGTLYTQQLTTVSKCTLYNLLLTIVLCIRVLGWLGDDPVLYSVHPRIHSTKQLIHTEYSLHISSTILLVNYPLPRHHMPAALLPKGPLALGLRRLRRLVRNIHPVGSETICPYGAPTTRVPMFCSDGSVSVPAAAPPSPLMQEEGSPEIRFLASPSQWSKRKNKNRKLVWIRVIMISVGKSLRPALHGTFVCWAGESGIKHPLKIKGVVEGWKIQTGQIHDRVCDVMSPLIQYTDRKKERKSGLDLR